MYEAIPLRVSHVKELIFTISFSSKGHSSGLFKDIPAFELKKKKNELGNWQESWIQLL